MAKKSKKVPKYDDFQSFFQSIQYGQILRKIELNSCIKQKFQKKLKKMAKSCPKKRKKWTKNFEKGPKRRLQPDQKIEKIYKFIFWPKIGLLKETAKSSISFRVLD